MLALHLVLDGKPVENKNFKCKISSLFVKTERHARLRKCAVYEMFTWDYIEVKLFSTGRKDRTG